MDAGGLSYWRTSSVHVLDERRPQIGPDDRAVLAGTLEVTVPAGGTFQDDQLASIS